MADMIRDKDVTTFRRRRRPRPMYSAGQEKNRPDHKATKKAERPITRGNRGFRRGIIRRFHSAANPQPQKRYTADYTDLGFGFLRVDFQVVLAKKQDSEP